MGSSVSILLILAGFFLPSNAGDDKGMRTWECNDFLSIKQWTSRDCFLSLFSLCWGGDLCAPVFFQGEADPLHCCSVIVRLILRCFVIVI